MLFKLVHGDEMALGPFDAVRLLINHRKNILEVCDVDDDYRNNVTTYLSELELVSTTDEALEQLYFASDTIRPVKGKIVCYTPTRMFFYDPSRKLRARVTKLPKWMLQ